MVWVFVGSCCMANNRNTNIKCNLSFYKHKY